MGEIKMYIFKIGDKVRVRKDLKVGHSYNCVTFVSEMLDYMGGEYEIEKVTVSGEYQLTGCNAYWFNNRMLEPVQEEPKEEESKEGYSFQEVITRIKPGETYVNTDKVWRLEAICMNSSGTIDIKYASEGRNVTMISIYNEFKLMKPKKNYTLYVIEHHPDGERYKFRSDNEDLRIGAFVTCNNTIHGKTYGRVVNIVSHVLTKDEYLDVKECFPV